MTYEHIKNFLSSLFTAEFLRDVVSDFCGGILAEPLVELAEHGLKGAVSGIRSHRETKALSCMQAELDRLFGDKSFADAFANDLRKVTHARRGTRLDMKVMKRFLMRRTKKFPAYVGGFSSCKDRSDDEKKALVAFLEELHEAVFEYHLRAMNGDRRADMQTLLYMFEARLGDGADGDYLARLAEGVYVLPTVCADCGAPLERRDGRAVCSHCNKRFNPEIDNERAKLIVEIETARAAKDDAKIKELLAKLSLQAAELREIVDALHEDTEERKKTEAWIARLSRDLKKAAGRSHRGHMILGGIALFTLAGVIAILSLLLPEPINKIPEQLQVSVETYSGDSITLSIENRSDHALVAVELLLRMYPDPESDGHVERRVSLNRLHASVTTQQYTVSLQELGIELDSDDRYAVCVAYVKTNADKEKSFTSEFSAPVSLPKQPAPTTTARPTTTTAPATTKPVVTTSRPVTTAPTTTVRPTTTTAPATTKPVVTASRPVTTAPVTTAAPVSTAAPRVAYSLNNTPATISDSHVTLDWSTAAAGAYNCNRTILVKNAEDVRIVGNPFTTYQKLTILVQADSSKSTNVTIHLENVAMEGSLKQSGSVALTLTLDCVGTSSISAAQGNSAISVSKLVFSGSGNFRAKGGRGSDGADGSDIDADFGCAASDGLAGGDGSIAVDCTSVSLSGAVKVTLVGGDGADGGDGGDVIGSGCFEGQPKLGRGGHGGDGGDGAAPLPLNATVSISSGAQLTVQYGDGGRGGDAGCGGSASWEHKGHKPDRGGDGGSGGSGGDGFIAGNGGDGGVGGYSYANQFGLFATWAYGETGSGGVAGPGGDSISSVYYQGNTAIFTKGETGLGGIGGASGVRGTKDGKHYPTEGVDYSDTLGQRGTSVERVFTVIWVE